MDKQKARGISFELAEALEGINEQFGVNLSVGSVSYGSNDIKLSVKGIENASDGTTVDPRTVNFAADAAIIGLGSEIGTTFFSRGSSYTISGINRKARKYPVCATRDSDGKRFKFPVDVANRVGQIAPSH